MSRQLVCVVFLQCRSSAERRVPLSFDIHTHFLFLSSESDIHSLTIVLAQSLDSASAKKGSKVTPSPSR
ncbi:hypothetical protein Q7C36_011088 [Tachysurus vachellii]|uniref:Uncharacterized protein n=1 Tax=Tachysurus vachellii TaxID=175792 RepID=A0AA88N0C5_TACVA|nr:hypothetical protein Q7C36_011088 [Tachysurus vachellii]